MNQQKILIVDDLVENLTLLVSIFEQYDYELLIARNGGDALKVAHNSHPDIILLDINMPGKNGYEVCKELKASPHTKNIPVFFLTASVGVANESSGLALGAVDYISKPYSAEIVLARVKNHLELKLYQDHLQELVSQGLKELEETNTALRVILSQQKEAREEIKLNILVQLEKSIFPYIDLLAHELKDERNKEYLDILTEHLRSIGSAFIQGLSNPCFGLTKKEVLVADLVRQGKTSKQIASLLNIETQSVEAYRNKIRKKLDINNKKISLFEYLNSDFSA